jgi:predicted pyridoxine 5'-phosphate oxidase superfamily flavin-nucleotide-binding protein
MRGFSRILILAAPLLRDNTGSVLRHGAGAMQKPSEKLELAMQMAERARYVLLATVDESGTPRLTPVEECSPAGEGRLSIRAWVEVPPLHDRGGRSGMVLLLWDEHGRGYQLTGRALQSLDTAVLNGLADVEQQTHFPQVERDILMQVESVEDFHLAHTPLPHR